MKVDSGKRIALGMSGGVDSAVSAALLLRAGYDVVGVTCLFIEDEAALAAAEDAKAVCARFGISHVVRSCAAAFEQTVVAPFVSAYETGLTPSPCVRCNAGCKIPFLLEAAHELGCGSVATGHYARVACLLESGRFVIKTALDVSKDQSYMLALLTQEHLSRLVLPLGGATKAEVRILASELGLHVADKPESQDICFFDGDYADFLGQRGVKDRPGDIVDSAGKILGRHQGLFRYTVGQRKGIGVAAPRPYYVIGKRTETNELVVGFEEETRISQVRVADINWQAFEQLEDSLECMVKLRYRSRQAACTVRPETQGAVGAPAVVDLLSPQPTTAPGQYAVFYQGETVLGGGVIQEAW